MIINEVKEKVYEIDSDEITEIDAAPNGKPIEYRELNAMIHAKVLKNCKKIIIHNVCGQRFIGAALKGFFEIIINGIPGNDLGIFMDGPKITVNGNCEDQVGNTMNQGSLIINGDGGDVIGLSARGGTIYVKGDVGYRVGIHIKEYENKFPIIIIGGSAKDFLGEYMAGGIIIVLGLKFLPDGSIIDIDQPICGNELGTGIHRGSIYLRTDEKLEEKLGVGAKIMEYGEKEKEDIVPFLYEYCKTFNIPFDLVINKQFQVVRPISKRPYGGTYCSAMI
jgi:glutamate synthase domain-containing protein 3